MKRLLAAAAAVAVAVGCTCASATAASSGSGFYVRGGGFGHGIGMSAYGDAGYAQHGWAYRRILAHYYAGTAVGHVSPNRNVNVLLAQGAATFTGATKIAGSTKQLKAKSHYGVLVSGSRLRLVSGGRAVGTFKAPLRVSGPGAVRLLGVGLYDGALVFRPDGHSVQTVNSVGVDAYVRGVMAPEMPPSWPMQSLEAFAVAARSVGLMTNVAPGDFNVYDDSRSQNYRGVGAETARTNVAVARTSGQVVTYHGSMVEVFYFASSGGFTESIQNVWPGAIAEPWLRGVVDPYDDSFGNPYYRWRQNLSIASAGAKLRGYYSGSLRGIRILRTGVSPRIITARVVGTRGSRTVSGATLQGVFGTLSTAMNFTTIRAQARTSPRSVSGTVFPVLRGVRAYVQQRRDGRWVTVGSQLPSAAGSYRVTVPAVGSYRTAYYGVDGAVITVH